MGLRGPLKAYRGIRGHQERPERFPGVLGARTRTGLAAGKGLEVGGRGTWAHQEPEEKLP